MKLSLGLEQRMSLRQEHHLVLNLMQMSCLSPLELELLLDRSFEGIIDFHNKNPDYAGEKSSKQERNYFFSKEFSDKTREVKGKIPISKYLEIPQFFLEKKDDSVQALYNPNLDRKLSEKLSLFRRSGEKAPLKNIFSRMVLNSRKWVIEKQSNLIKHVCEKQNKYLESHNSLDFEPLTQENIGDYLGLHNSTISKILRNLTVQLPDKRVVFVKGLIPGNKISVLKGVHILNELQCDDRYFEKGKWKISDYSMIEAIKEKYDIGMATRTLRKYKGLLDKELSLE